MEQSGSEQGSHEHYALRAGVAAMAVSGALIVIKGWAWGLSGSASVLASLIDSMMDICVSGLNFLAIRYALQPPDREHRHGHGKMEGLAAVCQAAMIAGAGVFLILESLDRLQSGQPVAQTGTVIVVMAVAIALTFSLVAYQKWVLSRAPSLAVEADRAHYSADLAVHAGTIAVMLALRAGGPVWLDPVFALLVALWFGYTAFTIGAKGLDMLLDRELPDDLRYKIAQTVCAHPKVCGLHDLRTRKSGMRRHISFDLELDPEMTLRAAHDVAREVEHTLLGDYPDAEILIHQDPADDPDDTRHQVKDVHMEEMEDEK